MVSVQLALLSHFARLPRAPAKPRPASLPFRNARLLVVKLQDWGWGGWVERRSATHPS